METMMDFSKWCGCIGITREYGGPFPASAKMSSAQVPMLLGIT